jgi:hypothetical protein
MIPVILLALVVAVKVFKKTTPNGERQVGEKRPEVLSALLCNDTPRVRSPRECPHGYSWLILHRRKSCWLLRCLYPTLE